MTTLSITIAKTGKTYEREVEKLPPASIEYLLRNGYSQRLRDCHASIKRADYETDAGFVADVEEAVDEVLRQLDTGDVPGTRAPADETTKQVKRVAAVAREAGIDFTKIDPEKLVAFLKRQVAQGHAA